MVINMEYAVIGIVVAAIIAVGIIFFVKSKKKNADLSMGDTQSLTQNKKGELIPSSDSLHELVIKFEKLPAEKMPDQNKLIEIKDNKVLAHVNNLIPEIAQVRNTAQNVAQVAEKSGDILYTACPFRSCGAGICAPSLPPKISSVRSPQWSASSCSRCNIRLQRL